MRRNGWLSLAYHAFFIGFIVAPLLILALALIAVLPAAARLKPSPGIAKLIRDSFARHAGRPAVGVHIRQASTTSSRISSASSRSRCAHTHW